MEVDEEQNKKQKTAPPDSIRVYVKWSQDTAELFQHFQIPWTERELMNIPSPNVPMSIDDMSCWIERRLESLYDYLSQGAEKLMVQVQWIKTVHSDQALQWTDPARQHLNDEDTVLVQCQAMLESLVNAPSGPGYSKKDLKEIRKNLRFGLSDRVLCNCGPLWLSGGIVGSAVESEGELFPYVVKTDPLPGLPSRTISVPGDNEHVCIQEVCFNPVSELHLIKSAAATRVTSSRPNLRFAEGDKVAVRIKNSTQDGLEQWMSGIVSTVWPRLPGERQWSFAGMSGEFPQEVPYKVDLSPGPPNFVFVHWDNHTLIRRDGLQPQDRVKGISKRLEIRTCEDGSVEQFDHLTERHKPVPRRPMVDPKDMEVSDSDSD